MRVTSGKIRVTDPCYSVGTWCSGEFPAKNGEWIAETVLNDEGRVATLMISHVDHQGVDPDELLSIEVGVDSGTCGFFDAGWYEKYNGDEHSEDRVAYFDIVGLNAVPTTLDEPEENLPDGVLSSFLQGVASSSGYGDGSYSCEVARDEKGDVIVARVTFITEEDDEDDDESWWDEETEEEEDA